MVGSCHEVFFYGVAVGGPAFSIEELLCGLVVLFDWWDSERILH